MRQHRRRGVDEESRDVHRVESDLRPKVADVAESEIVLRNRFFVVEREVGANGLAAGHHDRASANEQVYRRPRVGWNALVCGDVGSSPRIGRHCVEGRENCDNVQRSQLLLFRITRHRAALDEHSARSPLLHEVAERARLVRIVVSGQPSGYLPPQHRRDDGRDLARCRPRRAVAPLFVSRRRDVRLSGPEKLRQAVKAPSWQERAKAARVLLLDLAA